jgi:D-arabinonate dehydratase
MKIIDLNTYLLFCPFKSNIHDAARKITGRDVLLIEIKTEGNITGIGFLTGVGAAHGSEMHVINEIIQKGLKPITIDKDLLSIENLWNSMYHQTLRYGRKGAAVRAISGVDIALWDAIGKSLNKPVYKLIGGYSDSARVYASGGFYSDRDDMQELIDEMKRYVDMGFRAIKMKVGRDVKKDIARVEAVRSAVGKDIDLLVDANEAWDLSTALRFLKGVEPCNIFWLEEPIKPDDIDGFIALTKKSFVPIAAGENEYTKYGFKELITRQAINIAQPDVTRVGGVTEWLKVAAIAQAYNIPCIPHAVQEIHISLVAAVPNAPMMEYFTSDHFLQSFLSALFCEPVSLHRIREGYVQAPQQAGLGLEVDWDLAKRYQV